MNKSATDIIKDDLVKLIEQKLGTEIFKDRFDCFSLNISTTSLKDEELYNIESEDIELTPENKALKRIFEKCFSIWEAGSGNEGLFKTLYAFPKMENELKPFFDRNILDLKKELIPVNLREDYVNYFVSCLASRAISVKKSSRKIDASNRSRFFLVGDVGTGKTTFLNYAFSLNYRQLYKAKVMWIRVDLTKEYHSNKTLSEAVSFQLSKVFRGNYESDLLKYKDEIESKIKKQFSNLPTNETVSDERISNYVQDYFTTYDSERSDHYHPVIMSSIKEIVQSKFSMIYIFDGLDRYGADKIFHSKLKNLKEFITGSEKTKHVYIFTMRNESYADLLYQRIFDHGGTTEAALRTSSKTFSLMPSQISDIIDNRLNLICDKWKNILEEERDELFVPNKLPDEGLDAVNIDLLRELVSKYKWITPDTIKAYYDIFLRFLYRGLSTNDSKKIMDDWHPEEAYHALQNTIGTNTRILLKVICLIHECFLQSIQLVGIGHQDILDIHNILNSDSNKKMAGYRHKLHNILAKYYRVTPVLLRHKNVYIHPFKYILDDNNKLCRQHKLNEKDIPFLINVYRGACICNKDKQPLTTLYKIRIIQDLNNNKYYNISELIDNLNSLFSYSKEHLKVEVKELSDMHIIKRRPHDNMDGSVFYTYELSDIGIHFLHTLMFNFNYIRIILDDTTIPTTLKELFKKNTSYSFDNNKLLWNISQIPRVVRFCLLIKEVERQEKIKFSGDKFCDWEISKKMSSSVKNTISYIFNRVQENHKDTVKTILRTI